MNFGYYLQNSSVDKMDFSCGERSSDKKLHTMIFN